MSTYYEHSDKAGKCLANQLCGFRAKQLIPGIRTTTGEITSDLKCINNKFKAFHSKLYTSDNTAVDLEIPVIQEEIIAAISSMQSVKSSDPDGFSTDFF